MALREQVNELFLVLKLISRQEMVEQSKGREATIARLEIELQQAMDQNGMKRLVVDIFNTRMVALESQTTTVQLVQSAMLETLREMSLQVKQNAQENAKLTAAKKKRLADDLQSLE